MTKHSCCLHYIKGRIGYEAEEFHCFVMGIGDFVFHEQPIHAHFCGYKIHVFQEEKLARDIRRFGYVQRGQMPLEFYKHALIVAWDRGKVNEFE